MNSNEDDSRPWIPWELIKPYDDEAGQPLIDHDFLCLRFDLARWVCPAPSSAAAEISVDTLACIMPSDRRCAGPRICACLLRPVAISTRSYGWPSVAAGTVPHQGRRSAQSYVAGLHPVRTSQRARPFWQRLKAMP